MSYSVGAHLPRREALLSAGPHHHGADRHDRHRPLATRCRTSPSASLLFVAGPVRARHGASGAGDATSPRSPCRPRRSPDEADSAVDAERRRIARELHDVVSHAVTLIAVQAEAGQSVLDRDPEAARRSLAAIGQVSREALAELARLLAVLREDDEASPEAGLAQVDNLVEGARAAGLDVTLLESGEPG